MLRKQHENAEKAAGMAASTQERWQSGRMRRTRNPVYGLYRIEGSRSLPFQSNPIQIKARGMVLHFYLQSSCQFRAGLESTDPDSVGRSGPLTAARACTQAHQPALPGRQPSGRLTPEQIGRFVRHCSQQRSEGTQTRNRPPARSVSHDSGSSCGTVWTRFEILMWQQSE